MKKDTVLLFDREIPQFARRFEDFNWENQEMYMNYLAQSYYYVTHSVKLLRYAFDACSVAQSDIRERLQEHIREESGHEKMALNDLLKLGGKIEDYHEYAETKNMYQYVYDQIDQHGPIAIFAYALALEGMSQAACPGVAKKLIAEYGKENSSFIYHHGVLDQEHVGEGLEALSNFSKQELEWFQEIFVHSIKHYTDMLDRVESKK